MKIILPIILVCTFIVVGFVLFMPFGGTPAPTQNKCGDTICELDEDCNSCLADCGCQAGERCDTYSGVCKKEICGDGIIQTGETKYTCCEDVGCGVNEVCNKLTNSCIQSTGMTNKKATEVANAYLVDNNLVGNITLIEDAYYGQIAVKKVIINCAEQGSKYPCGLILLIAENETIVKEYHTI